MYKGCNCKPGCTLSPISPHFPARPGRFNDVTATTEEQRRLKEAHASGSKIEAKGRETVDCGYEWDVVEKPRWDFRNNHYRLAVI